MNLLVFRGALELNVRPSWLDSSHVYHLNGTIENFPNNSFRSPFLLEEDCKTQRANTLEADIIYNKMIWDRTFVVAGMSFECETDQFLLRALSKVEDDLPIGESLWVIVNPDKNVLKASCWRIKNVLPKASVKPICDTFSKWMDSGMKTCTWVVEN